jgi:hypothetical protein
MVAPDIATPKGYHESARLAGYPIPYRRVMTAITPSVETKSHLWLEGMDRNYLNPLVNCLSEKD